jgi:hypothetical protein
MFSTIRISSVSHRDDRWEFLAACMYAGNQVYFMTLPLQMIWCQERGRTAKCRRSVASSCYFAPSTCFSQLFSGSSPFLSQVRNIWLILLYHLASVVDPKLGFPYTDPVPTLLYTFVSGSGLFFKYSFLKPNFIFFFVLKSSRTNRKTRFLIKGLSKSQMISERHDSFTV